MEERKDYNIFPVQRIMKIATLVFLSVIFFSFFLYADAAADCSEAVKWLYSLGYVYASTAHELRVWVRPDKDLEHTEISPEKLSSLNICANARSLVISGVKAHPGLQNLRHFSGLNELSLDRTNVGDVDMVHLKGLKGLKELSLRNTNITDKGLEHLKDMRQISKLDLTGTRVKGEGFRHLSKLSNLHSLYIWKTEITDASMENLASLLALESVNLLQTNISSAGLKHLANLRRLRYIEIEGSRINDSTLSVLASFTNWETLVLRHVDFSYGFYISGPLKHDGYFDLSLTRVNDDGLRYLLPIENLRHLKLGNLITDRGMVVVGKLTGLVDLELGKQITDRGLVHLTNLKNLKKLTLGGSRVTKEGRVMLFKAIPGIRFYR
jgi:internalin A